MKQIAEVPLSITQGTPQASGTLLPIIPPHGFIPNLGQSAGRDDSEMMRNGQDRLTRQTGGNQPLNRRAVPARRLPISQTGPGNRCAAAITWSNERTMWATSAAVMTREGSSLMTSR